MLRRDLPPALAFKAVLHAARGQPPPDGPGRLPWLRNADLAARVLRLDALCAIDPQLLPAGARVPLACTCLLRALIEAQRLPARERVVAAIHRLLAAERPGAVREAQALADWGARTGRDGASPPADAIEEVATRVYLDDLRALRRHLDVLGSAVDEALALLETPPAGAPSRVRILGCFTPPLTPPTPALLPGLLVEGAFELHAPRGADGDGGDEGDDPAARERLAAMPDLVASIREARRMVEGHHYGAPLHAGLRLPWPAAARGAEAVQPLALEGRSAGLGLLAAFLVGVGHRNPLPPVVGFTGALADGGALPIAGAAAKRDVAAAHGIRVLFMPEANAADLARETPRAAGAGAAVEVVPVPAALRGAELIEWLEKALHERFPSLLDHSVERLHFLLARALGLAQTGGRADARAELHFLRHVAERRGGALGDSVAAVAWAGIGRTWSHEADSRQALEHYDEAASRLDRLQAERRLHPVAFETWLDLDNLRAVALNDLLRFEAAESLVRANLARKQHDEKCCAAALIGASRGTLGQVLTLRGALDASCYAEAVRELEAATALVEANERPRDRIYQATALLRAGEISAAIVLLQSVLDEVEPAAEAGRREAAESRLYALLRLAEAHALASCGAAAPTGLTMVGTATAATPPDAEDGLAICERLASLGPHLWMKPIVDKWTAVLRTHAGHPLDDALQTLEVAQQTLRTPSDPIHPDRALAAGCDLERAILLANLADPARCSEVRGAAASYAARAADALDTALALLIPFAAAATPGDATTLESLLARARAARALAADDPPALAAAARALALALPY